MRAKSTLSSEPRCPVRTQMSLKTRRKILFTPLVAPITASGRPVPTCLQACYQQFGTGGGWRFFCPLHMFLAAPQRTTHAAFRTQAHNAGSQCVAASSKRHKNGTMNSGVAATHAAGCENAVAKPRSARLLEHECASRLSSWTVSTREAGTCLGAAEGAAERSAKAVRSTRGHAPSWER
jgi:hypothetical protein